jgi:hypothetical protein
LSRQRQEESGSEKVTKDELLSEMTPLVCHDRHQRRGINRQAAHLPSVEKTKASLPKEIWKERAKVKITPPRVVR